MLSRFKTESSLDFNCLSLVGLENVTLLGTNKILEGTSILVVLQRGTTKDLDDWLVINLECLGEDELVDWTITEFFHIPPENATVSGC